MELVHQYEQRAKAANANARGRVNGLARVEWFRIADEWTRLADARMKEIGLVSNQDDDRHRLQ